MIGQIARIVADKGFGFIRAADNTEYFFHSSVCAPGEFEGLQTGRQVEFQPCNTAKGPRAINVVTI